MGYYTDETSELRLLTRGGRTLGGGGGGDGLGSE
jgi:hypothetical protein